MKINKWMIGGIIIVFVLIIILISISYTYNGMVNKSENTDGAWADVEAQYQRRADLIPNLVETVKGFASQEQTILTEVTAARSAWAAAGSQEQKIEAASQMDSALSRLLVVVENYPDLKSNVNFLALQDELAGTENRINVARIRFNQQVLEYNKYIKRFPNNMFARMFGFDEKEFFESKQGSEDAPKVNF